MLSPRIFCVVLFILSCTMTTFGWASDDDRKTISGTVTDTDWVKSIITVRYSQLYSSDMDEIDIIVPSDAKLTCGAGQISLSDIEESDPVTVTYYDDGLSGLKATRVTDLNETKRSSE